MIGPQRQDGSVSVDHHDFELHAVTVDGDHFQVALDFLVDLARRQRLTLVLEQLQQGVPLLGLRVETAQGFDRIRQTGPDAQKQLPRIDGLFHQLGPALGHGGHFDAEADACFGIGFVLLGLAKERKQLRDLVTRKVVLAIEGNQFGVEGLRLLHPAEALLGLV